MSGHRMFATIGRDFDPERFNGAIVASEDPAVALMFTELRGDGGDPEISQLRLTEVTASKSASMDDLEEACRELGIDTPAGSGHNPHSLLTRPDIQRNLEAMGFDCWHGSIPASDGDFEVTILWDARSLYIVEDPEGAEDFSFEKDENGNLALSVNTMEGRDLLAQWLSDAGSEGYVIGEIIEHMGWAGNARLYLVDPEDVGALTSSVILTDEATVNDDGETEVTGDVWWFPNYMVRDYAHDLLSKGSVTFTFAPADPSPAP